MSDVTIKQLAQVLGMPVDKLLGQLAEAGDTRICICPYQNHTDDASNGLRGRSFSPQMAFRLLAPDALPCAPHLQHRFLACQKQGVVRPARQEFHLGAGLAVVGLKTERQRAITGRGKFRHAFGAGCRRMEGQ